MKKAAMYTLFAVSFLLFGCGGAGGSAEDQIQTTMKEFESALHAGDYNKIKSLVTKDNTEFGDEEQFKMVAPMMKTVKFELSDIKVDGNNATANMKMTMEFMGETQTMDETASFKLEDGKWKISSQK